jgi:hypothetical protein
MASICKKYEDIVVNMVQKVKGRKQRREEWWKTTWFLAWTKEISDKLQKSFLLFKLWHKFAVSCSITWYFFTDIYMFT